MFVILLLHLQFLAPSVEYLYQGICAKMTSSFCKKVLIEQSEQYRREQRKLREHLLELQAMVRLLNNMKDITVNTKHTVLKRLNLIPGLQIKFYKLKTNWISKRRDTFVSDASSQRQRHCELCLRF